MDIYETLNADITINNEFIEGIRELYKDDKDCEKLVEILNKGSGQTISNIQVLVNDDLYIDADDIPDDVYDKIKYQIEEDIESDIRKKDCLNTQLTGKYADLLWKLEKISNNYGDTKPLTNEELKQLNDLIGELTK